MQFAIFSLLFLILDACWCHQPLLRPRSRRPRGAMRICPLWLRCPVRAAARKWKSNTRHLPLTPAHPICFGDDSSVQDVRCDRPGPVGRIWKTYNILVTFDANNVVKTAEIVPDKLLISHFVDLQRSGAFPPLNLSEPLHVHGLKATHFRHGNLMCLPRRSHS